MEVISSFLTIIIIALCSFILGAICYKKNLFPINILVFIKNLIRNNKQIINKSYNGVDFFSLKLPAKKLSYFKMDKNGNLCIDKIKTKKENNGIYFEVKDDYYDIIKEFNNKNTAIVIMDAWKDSGDKAINDYYFKLFKSSILPLVNGFIKKKYAIFAFTNKKTTKAYGDLLFDELETFIRNKVISKFYHNHFDYRKFENLLSKNNIRNLIYIGFASNICVIGRPVGMFSMRAKGFETFFIPEASAAVEHLNSWKTGEIHKFTTKLIQQNFSGTLDKKKLLKELN